MPRAVILTALPVEYLAVRAHLTNLQEEMHPQGTIYERGTFISNEQTWEVGIAEVGAGNAGTAIEAERAISHFKPDILLFVGIAGGIKDVVIGDVVAATKVYGYESGKVGEQFFTRPALGQSAYTLIQRARAEARKGEWLSRLPSIPVLQPRVFVAPIAAGEKVVVSKESDVFNFIRASYNDAIALEMEGFGFLSAAFAYPNIKAIVIRGISDLIKDKNADDLAEGTEEERQEKASRNVSAFAFEMLTKVQLEEINQLSSQESTLRLDLQESVHTNPIKDDNSLKDEMRQMTVLVFTDLENSTPMKQYMPGDTIMERNAAYRKQILEPHRERIRGLLIQYHGIEREEPQGDGFLLEFLLPTDAASFAISVQESHRNLAILDGQSNSIRVKIGMQMAYPNPASEIDYAARVIGFATGGQILITESLYTLLKDADIKGVGFHFHGNHDLKGIGEKPLFELLYDSKSPQPTKNSDQDSLKNAELPLKEEKENRTQSLGFLELQPSNGKKVIEPKFGAYTEKGDISIENQNF